MGEIFFKIQNVTSLTSSVVFERGEDYYENGYVGKITKKGNIFNGIVSGTYKYKVSLDISNNKLSFRCSCPYDDYGICKHSVSFAIAIINGEYKEEKIEHIVVFSKEDFEKRFKAVSDDKKIKFLKQILDKDANLQSQFINYTESKEKPIDSLVIIKKVREDIFNDLSTLDFDDISDQDYDYNYYSDEDDSLIEEAHKIIADAFKKYYKQAEDFIRKGDLTSAINIILGMYEGSQDLPELDNEDYCIFNDEYNSNVKEILIDNIKKLSDEIQNTVKSDKDIISCINLIISRFNYYGYNYKPKNDEYGMKIVYEPEDFEQLFLSIISNERTAIYLHELLVENDLACLELAFLILKIAEISKNDKLWIETAEQFAEYKSEITKKLLEKYKNQNKEEDFNRIAKIAFEKYPSEFDSYLINNLNKKNVSKLYIEVLKHYTKTKFSTSHYKELRDYLSEEDKNDFIVDISKRYNSLFYIQVLEIEQYYDKILAFVKGNTYNPYFDKTIEPIINIYPEECFFIIKNRCITAMSSQKRNRDTYHDISKWLKLMKQIKGKEEETKKYIFELYNHKPNLPALKDEIKKAKLF